MIKCPSCGAELSFSVEEQQVTCEYCRSTFNPKELDIKAKTAEEKTYEGKSFLCSQCGAELLTFDETAITFCSYCGSQAMIESKMIKHNNPDFIIPFKKTKEECINAYKKKVSQSLFAPTSMKSDIVVNKFRGIYIPYCIYKLSFKGVSSHKGERYKGRVGDYVYYDDYSISANVDAEYDGVSFDLISNFSDKFSQSIPHDFKEAEKFNTNYLAGFYADAVDVDNYIYEELAESIVNNDSIDRMLKIKEYTKYNCKMSKLDFNVEDKKVGMFPVYFLAIRDKKNKKVNYAIVNGQTGKVAIDLPVDFTKYLLTSILLAVPIFLLINNLLVLTPQTLCILAIIFAIIGLIISNYHANKIHERENHFDDIGYINNNTDIKYTIETKKIQNKSSVPLLIFLIILCFSFPYFAAFSEMPQNMIKIFSVSISIVFIVLLCKTKKSVEFKTDVKMLVRNRKHLLSAKKRFKYIYKAILAILLGLCALFANFVYDIYYYGTAVIMFLLVIWTFLDLIKYHNILVSTKLPQLNKRGGDGNE